jgi:hypothetical protein
MSQLSIGIRTLAMVKELDRVWKGSVGGSSPPLSD